MKRLNYYLILIAVIFTNNVFAEEDKFLTVDDLLDNGYTVLTGEQILAIMREHLIEVVDIETRAVTISKKDKSPVGMERKFTEVKGDKASAMLDARLLARAPMLEGSIERKVVGNELIATDGLRTYHYRLYQKEQKTYAVRDIDNGNVFLEVKIK